MVEQLTVSDLFDFLEDSGISAQITNAILENDVGGKELLCLSEEEIKELAPKIGDRVKLRSLISKYKVCYD